MHTEVQVSNSNYTIVPGMYAYVDLPTARNVNVLAVPIQSVRQSGEGAGSVLVVNGQGAIESRQVKLGMETADSVEIVSGLKENELIIFGEQSEFRPGEIVKPKLVNPANVDGSQ
jgi:multidrug efflux pump subunit AcrA (membrane-fusion protein)